MEIFLLAYLCVNIAFRAKARGLNSLPWVLRTVLACFAGMFVAVAVVYISWLQKFGSTPKDMERIQAMMLSGELVPNGWSQLAVFVCCVGGYLVVRYRLDKHPIITPGDKDNSPS